jgi:hypothetical protein
LGAAVERIRQPDLAAFVHGDEWHIERNVDVVRMIIVVVASRGVKLRNHSSNSRDIEQGYVQP